MVDPRVAGAGIAMAIGMMALLPTFNALNNSYMTDVQPPPWMPTPDDLPDDFKPPEDWEPPEGWEPPPDMEIPEGWEPPPGYEGPIPPGGCPDPLKVVVEEMDNADSFDATWDGFQQSFDVPKYTVAIAVNVTFSGWQAQRVSASLAPPTGDPVDDFQDGASPSLLGGRPTEDDAVFSLTFVVDPTDLTTMPPEGTYTLTLDADFPITGSYRTTAEYAVYCGGLLE